MPPWRSAPHGRLSAGLHARLVRLGTVLPYRQAAAIRAQGRPIGSGSVESSAGHVVQQRRKRAGQRWSERAAAAAIARRARSASQRPLVVAA